MRWLPGQSDVPWPELDAALERAAGAEPESTLPELLGTASLFANELGHEARSAGDGAKAQRCILASRIFIEIHRAMTAGPSA